MTAVLPSSSRRMALLSMMWRRQKSSAWWRRGVEMAEEFAVRTYGGGVLAGRLDAAGQPGTMIHPDGVDHVGVPASTEGHG
jgi:hypothetical protein